MLSAADFYVKTLTRVFFMILLSVANVCERLGGGEPGRRGTRRGRFFVGLQMRRCPDTFDSRTADFPFGFGPSLSLSLSFLYISNRTLPDRGLDSASCETLFPSFLPRDGKQTECNLQKWLVQVWLYTGSGTNAAKISVTILKIISLRHPNFFHSFRIYAGCR